MEFPDSNISSPHLPIRHDYDGVNSRHSLWKWRNVPKKWYHATNDDVKYLSEALELVCLLQNAKHRFRKNAPPVAVRTIVLRQRPTILLKLIKSVVLLQTHQLLLR